MRVSLVTTHPIQYDAPWLRALSAQAGVELTVHFACLPDAESQGVGFGMPFQWDVPILDGYRWKTFETAAAPDLSRFLGLRLRHPLASLREARPEAVIVTGWNSAALVQALGAARRLRVPAIARGDSTSQRNRPAWKKLSLRTFLSRFRAFLTSGRRNEEFYRSLGIEDEKLFPCRHFVDNARFEASAASHRLRRDEIRAKWGIGTDAVVPLFAGKLLPIKRVSDLIEAAAICRRQFGRLHLLVAGSGPEENALRQQAGRLGVPAAFAGFLNQSEIAQAYAAADFVVLPSESETWGLVVNEAMVCGLPAIVSDGVGCAPDLVIEGETGGIFPKGNVDALASRITTFALDLPRTRAMGERARERVSENYSVEKAVEGTVAALRYVMEEPHPPSPSPGGEGVAGGRG